MKMHVFLILGLILITAPGALNAQPPDDATPLNLTVSTTEESSPEPPSLTKSFVTMIGALGLVLGLIGAAAWAAKRFVPVQKIGAGGSSAIEIIGTRNIGAKQSLMLIRAGGEVFLIGRTAQSIATLGRLDDEAASLSSELSDGKSMSGKSGNGNGGDAFGSLLRRFEAEQSR